MSANCLIDTTNVTFVTPKKNRQFGKKTKELKKEHPDISHRHGKRDISCNSCHDINNHSYLVSTKAFPANFSNSSPVCARCHLERFRDWKRGLHGKRSGGWLTPLIQYHCIDCHHPHSVKFPEMPAMPPEEVPKDVILKDHETDQHHKE